MSQPLDRTQNVDPLIQPDLGAYRPPTDPIAAVANDLANLLAAMKGQAQLACDDPNGDEKDELVRVVLSATLKAEGVLQRLHESTNAAPLPIPPEPTPNSPPHILVADDETTVLMLLDRVLGNAGYQVTTADSGTAALALTHKHTFDIAFLDVQLGDMKGTDLYRLMAPHCQETHVIFMSGDPAVAREFNTSPSRQHDLFIRKPFDVNEIKQRVSTILTMKSALT